MAEHNRNEPARRLDCELTATAAHTLRQLRQTYYQAFRKKGDVVSDIIVAHQANLSRELYVKRDGQFVLINPSK